eukprot:CAMPEP_0202339666 /NCGR_PEP_ID=MMETSP1126-20121109/1429_1 /ASSEMBLY_ACC=CAM_ASM_000457 /TAXON_ID=3047 /ORGANISM="Dunaliella tertiolecta, Strain CCMP1320" /LENGTH=135 /DNA_ID=CAMNT_0048930247 /DNA_START=74 /DNA_END=481 /DNA_ORIENTATION=+
MTNVSNAVVWECVKKSNCFLRKGIHGGNHRTMFSAEPGNLYNKHSYKFSGLRHENDFVGVQANKDDTVDFIKGSKKNVGKPAKAATHYKWKQNARRSLVSVGKQVASMRPDLKYPAQARMAAVQKSLRVKKALSK